MSGSCARHRGLVLQGPVRAGGVPQAGQPALSVVALGDDSGHALTDASQRALSCLCRAVVHRSSLVSSHLFADIIEFRRKTLPGASEESLILPAQVRLSRG